VASGKDHVVIADVRDETIDRSADFGQHVLKHVHIGGLMTTMTATDARRGFFDVVKGATDKHQVFRIHHRRGSVVLMAENDYESILETMELLSTPGFRKSLKLSVDQMHRGNTLSFEEVFGENA
jgi:antitoxin YefM